MVKRGVTHILSNDLEVQAIVGQNLAGTKYKCYPVICPQPESSPYSVVRTTDKIPEDCKEKVPNTFTYSFDVYTYHKSSEKVEHLNNAIINALSNAIGIINGVNFNQLRLTNGGKDDYVVEHGLFVKISSFEAYVYEDQVT